MSIQLKIPKSIITATYKNMAKINTMQDTTILIYKPWYTTEVTNAGAFFILQETWKRKQQ